MEQQLEKIQLGIRRLQELHQKSLEEIELLKAENLTLREEIRMCQEQSTHLKHQSVVRNIAEKSARTNAEKKQMKLKINELVREVDKCIALLNQ